MSEGVKIILTYKGEVLLVKHTYGYKFTFPGGGLKKGESRDDAVKREVREELRISLTNPVYITSFVSTLYHKKDKIHLYKAELQNKECKVDNIEIDAVTWLPLDRVAPTLSHSASEIFRHYS